jgi:polysaccharide biosynthesis transport protein
MSDYQVDRGAFPGVTREQSSQGFDLRNGLRVLWRHKLLVAISMLSGLGVAQIVIWHTIPRYESESQVILDVRNTTVLKFESVLSGLPPQPEVLRTEMDVIASRSMAERVLDHLSPADVRQLADDGEMATPMAQFIRETWPEMVARLSSWAPLINSLTEASSPAGGMRDDPRSQLAPPNRDDLVSLILAGLNVSNDGRSYTIHIGFASPHAELGARLANLYAEQYLANQLDLKAGATKRANEWLSQRLLDLRAQLEASDAAVETFRRGAGILGGKGNTILTQQIGDVNTQLAATRNQRIDAESQLRTVQSQLESGGNLEALADVLSSQVVQTLRAKQAELTRQEAQLNGQYTAKYPNTKSIQTDIAALQRQIRDEINLVVKSLANRVEIARTKEQSLQRDLAGLEGQLGQGGEAEVKLQQLQREANATRSVYETYLSRFKEITEQQQLVAPDGYLISPAMGQGEATYPRHRTLLALGLVMGVVGGVTLAFLRDMFDRRLRSIAQVEEATGLPVVALMPSLPRFQFARPEDYVLDRRGSMYNEALRTTWAAVVLGRDQARRSSELIPVAGGFHLSRRRRRSASTGVVVLVTSSVPNEGKTAFCVSMARSLSVDGHKVLLIDGDLRRPGVAKSFGRSSEGRLTELLDGKIELHEAVQVDEQSGAHYLATQNEDAHPQDVLNSIRTEIVLDKARRSYDIILIDTPPILVAADAAIVAKFCDHSLFLVRWGATSRDCVVGALRRLTLYNVKISGTVLSHVNMRKHAQYATGEGYYRSYGRLSKLPRIAQRSDSRLGMSS